MLLFQALGSFLRQPEQAVSGMLEEQMPPQTEDRCGCMGPLDAISCRGSPELCEITPSSSGRMGLKAEVEQDKSKNYIFHAPLSLWTKTEYEMHAHSPVSFSEWGASLLTLGGQGAGT